MNKEVPVNEEQRQQGGERLFEVVLDSDSIVRADKDVERERKIAIFDLVEDNRFSPDGPDLGPYRLDLAMIRRKLVLGIRDEMGSEIATHILSLTPFRKIIKDYFIICESYYDAIRSASPKQIEAIDMGRRGLHDDGASILEDRLKGKITIDHQTARRLFTLICALQHRG
ncbi:hypothetical protein PsAD2_02478 [Pseudovibrio axinellae]|uniref:UPF0262 protein PsAD2_02478 n=1 Tax=Pseudovibrio axinellae TaxID=989403 RepID=A0A165YLS1_9HYPH|nr:UPF0262 family protein [Pseudovibrio axinellae]KZL18960.1 hypothetical protein PsAD2_02478 [Pseudovibrio axinellae]SEP86131.1 Uncharacterized protein, UPF0262 family [Pseudovibrio axinellae]